MTPDDMRSLREFFDSPEGRRVLGQIQASYEIKPITDSKLEAHWRRSPPGSLLYPPGCEVSNEIPLDASRTFKSIQQARPMSPWWAILLVGFLLIGWLAGCIYYTLHGGRPA